MPSTVNPLAASPEAPAKHVANASRLVYQPVIGFVEQIAAKSAAPGGGSAAALSGAIGAGLLTMVIRFTIEKPEYAAVASRLTAILQDMESCRATLTSKIDEDTEAFNRFRLANKLPARDELETARKSRELKPATAETINVPLSTMETCVRALQLAPEIARDGNINTVSDAATGTELLAAGVEGAAYNVMINLPGIDESERAQFRKLVGAARTKSRDIVAQVREIVSAKLGG